MQNTEGTGFLKIQASTADGAFPIPGAVVTVTDSEGKSIATLRTDASGITETIGLPAPALFLSQSPESSYPEKPPFSTYTVVIRKDGYYGIDDYSVPIFDSITSIQKANLIPLTEFSPLPPNPLPQRFETPGYPSLQNNGGIPQ